jgi:hypothetical protein
MPGLAERLSWQTGWSVEEIRPADLCQPDLHEAMLARRR